MNNNDISNNVGNHDNSGITNSSSNGTYTNGTYGGSNMSSASAAAEARGAGLQEEFPLSAASTSVVVGSMPPDPL